jgi:hypothetical protein
MKYKFSERKFFLSLENKSKAEYKTLTKFKLPLEGKFLLIIL